MVSKASAISVRSQFIADSIRIGGLKRAVLALPPGNTRKLEKVIQVRRELINSLLNP